MGRTIIAFVACLFLTGCFENQPRYQTLAMGQGQALIIDPKTGDFWFWETRQDIPFAGLRYMGQLEKGKVAKGEIISFACEDNNCNPMMLKEPNGGLVIPLGASSSTQK